MKRRVVLWRRQALADLQNYHDWLLTVEGAKPKRTVARIRAAVSSMRRLGDIGRPSIANVRALSVRNAPYVVLYSIDENSIEIVAIYHTAQDR